MRFRSRLRSVGIVLGALALLSLSVTSRAEEKQPRERPADSAITTAKLVLANELLRIHWAGWETDKGRDELILDVAQGINDGLKDKWKVEWLVSDIVPAKKKPTAFERAAVEEIRAGEPELRRRVVDGIHFVLPVRAKSTCLQCHTNLRPGGLPFEEGDLLGVASVLLKR